MKKTISLEDAQRMLGFKTVRSVKSFIGKCNIKIINSSGDLLLSLINIDDFCSAININNLPEKFLQISDVSKMLNIPSSQVSSLSRENFIPHYRLMHERGSRLLFVKEEIEDFMKALPEISILRSSNYHSFLWRYQQYEKIIQRWLLATKDNSESFHIFWDLIFGNENIESLAKKRGLTVERVKQKFNRKLRQMYFNPFDYLEKAAAVKKENVRLNIENTILKAKLEKANILLQEDTYDFDIENRVDKAVFLNQKIDSFNFSARIINRLKVYQIDTLKDLFFEISPSDFLKIRNFGKRSLKEINEFFKSKGFNWEEKTIE